MYLRARISQSGKDEIPDVPPDKEGNPVVIRILNCAPMSPWFPRWQLGAACLLVETDQGLVLVDTGLGLHDYECPSRLG